MTEDRRYEDIIGLKHRGSRRRRPMPMIDRAAQFAPFAALTGYEAAVKETERRTEPEAEVDEECAQEINRVLGEILQKIASQPLICVRVFEPDSKKAGGAYRSVTGRVRRIDRVRREIVLTDRSVIPIDRIHELKIED